MTDNETDEIVNIIAEAVASCTFGYLWAGGSKVRRAMQPVARQVIRKLAENGYRIER